MIQGLGTVFICLFLGFYLALGYLFFSQKIQNILKPLCQLPYILPSLFTILIGLNILNPFPYGHVGVIFIFTVVHLGFSTIFIADTLRVRIKNLGLISKIYNLKKTTFYFKILGPLIYKDLATLGLVIFLSCVSSLSIPLVVGGGKGTNLEVYIFEKIFIDQQWVQAIWLSISQGVFLFIISRFVFSYVQPNLKNKSAFTAINLKSKSAAVALIFFIGVYISSYLFKIIVVLFHTEPANIFDSDFLRSILSSVQIFLALMIAMFIFIGVIALRLFKNKKNYYMTIFLNPSTVLIGFSLYLLLPANHFSTDFIKILLGLFILFFASLYQSYLAAPLESLSHQILLARIYNIKFQIFFADIVWPQIKHHMIFVISLLYLISVSEFALIKATGSQIQTVGTLTQLYLKSYRLNQAYLLSFFSLVSWCVLYFLLRKIYVVDRKS